MPDTDTDTDTVPEFRIAQQSLSHRERGVYELLRLVSSQKIVLIKTFNVYMEEGIADAAPIAPGVVQFPLE